MTIYYNTQSTILYLAFLNNDPGIQSFLGPKCNAVSGEPPTLFNCAQCTPPLNDVNKFKTNPQEDKS